MKFCILTAGLLFFSASVFAGYTNFTNLTLVGSPDWRQCEMFLVDGSGGTNSSQWYGIPMAETGYKEMVAALLTAKSTGRQIQFIIGSGSPCGGDSSVAPVTAIIVN